MARKVFSVLLVVIGHDMLSYASPVQLKQTFSIDSHIHTENGGNIQVNSVTHIDNVINSSHELLLGYDENDSNEGNSHEHYGSGKGELVYNKNDKELWNHSEDESDYSGYETNQQNRDLSQWQSFRDSGISQRNAEHKPSQRGQNYGNYIGENGDHHYYYRPSPGHDNGIFKPPQLGSDISQQGNDNHVGNSHGHFFNKPSQGHPVNQENQHSSGNQYSHNGPTPGQGNSLSQGGNVNHEEDSHSHVGHKPTQGHPAHNGDGIHSSHTHGHGNDKPNQSIHNHEEQENDNGSGNQEITLGEEGSGSDIYESFLLGSYEVNSDSIESVDL